MYTIKNCLEIILLDLENSLKNGCLFSSLALALTIPDICGKAKYPDLMCGERYKKWFDDYIGNCEKECAMSSGRKINVMIPFLSGQLVYNLRCAFLHSGSANIENKYYDFKLDNFVLRIERKNKFDIYADTASLNGIKKESEYIVNVRRLCCILLWSAQSFLKNENEAIIKRVGKLKIQDFDRELQKLDFTSLNSHLKKYKIISWNCNGKFREKFNVIKTLDADIYIIQECEDPKQSNVDAYKEWASNHLWIGKEKNKGLGIFARHGIVLEELDWESLCLKYFIPVRVNNKFDLLGVWTQYPYIEEYYIYQYVNKHNYNYKTILFGDFNSNERFDNKCLNRKERGHTLTVNELNVLGFVDAYHYLSKEEQGRETKNTFYLYRHLDKGYHTDHCFIYPKLLKSYKVLDEDRWIKLSDHMPCVLEIEIKEENEK